MSCNPVRRFLLVWKEEARLGAWVDEHDLMLQVPRGFESWKGETFKEFRDWIYSQGYEAVFTGVKR